MELSEKLLCLFSAQVEQRDDSYVIEIPQQEVSTGSVEVSEVYQVATLSQTTQASPAKPASERKQDESEPPIEEDEVLDVEVEDMGDQGDGIDRIGPGYVVIVPETEMNERVTVKITEVRENMAFAEVVERHEHTA